MRNRIRQGELEVAGLTLTAMLLLPVSAALAGNGQSAKAQHTGPVAGATHGPSPDVVTVGAGTDSNETNGNSGPKSKPQGNRTPPSPQVSLCESYRGAVQTSCKETVVSIPRGAAPGKPRR